MVQNRERAKPSTYSILILFLEEVGLIPKSILTTKTRQEVYISAGIASCLLKDIELDNAKLVIRVPISGNPYQELKIPIQYDGNIPYNGKIRKLKQTIILKGNFPLEANIAKVME